MRLVLSIVLLLLGTGFHLLTEWYPEASWLQVSMMTAVYPACVVALGLLLIGLSGRFLPADPNLFSWGILGLVGSILLVPLLLAKNQQMELVSIEQEQIKEQRTRLVQEMRRQQQKLKAQEADRRERMKHDRFAQYEGRVPMDQLDALRKLDEKMEAAVGERSRKYLDALEANPTKGPATWLLSRSPEELDAQIASHSALYSETRAFTRFIETFEDTYNTEIEKLQLKPPADRIAVAELERILQMWERTQVYTLRQLDVSMLGEALKALNILRDAWGNWSYDPRTQSLSFLNPQNEIEFKQAVLRMQEIQKELENIN